MDQDDKVGLIGCFSTLLLGGLAAAGVVWLTNQDFSGAPEQAQRNALTRVAPIREPTVVERAARHDPLARHVNADSAATPEPPPQPGGLVAAVEGLGPLTEDPTTLPPLIDPEQLANILAAEAMCYRGNPPRRAPSLFNTRGFAVTFGANDFSGGDPLPRLEFFFDAKGISYLSLAGRSFGDFPEGREVVISEDSDHIARLIATWIANVATETCPHPPPFER